MVNHLFKHTGFAGADSSTQRPNLPTPVLSIYFPQRKKLYRLFVLQKRTVDVTWWLSVTMKSIILTGNYVVCLEVLTFEVWLLDELLILITQICWDCEEL